MAKIQPDYGFPPEELADGIYQRADGWLIVVIDGRTKGIWSKPRLARSDYRYHSRQARRDAAR